jgi:hypothetical protein
MSDLQSGTGPSGRRPRGALLERLTGDLLTLLQAMMTRLRMSRTVITVHLHEGHVVRVSHCNTATFSLPGMPESGEQSAAPPRDGDQRPRRTLTPNEINARLALRLNRLLRHFQIRFGELQIDVDAKGKIRTIRPSPPFRPYELGELARLLGKLPRGGAMDGSAAGSNSPKPDLQLKLRTHFGGRGKRGVPV